MSLASIKGEVWCFGVKVLVPCLNELCLTTVRRHDTQHNDKKGLIVTLSISDTQHK